MRKFLAAAILTAVPTCAFAQSEPMVPYIEANAGAAFATTVKTKAEDFFYLGNHYVGHSELDYGTELNLGGELGIAGFMNGAVRLGMSYDYVGASLNKASFVGTVNGVPTTISAPADQLLASTGFSGDTHVRLAMANAYYNFPMFGLIRPYVGVGAGVGVIQHASTEFAMTGTAGFRYAIDESVYLGFRYRFTRIWDPHTDFGVRLDPIQFHTVSAIIGVYLQ
jgi:opacity protein-like surface antigen